jgi:hypothetical protein
LKLEILYIPLFYLLCIGLTTAQGTCDDITIDASPACNGVGSIFDVNYTISNATGPFTITESLGGTTQNMQPLNGAISGLTYVNQNDKVTLTFTDESTNCMFTYDVLQLNCSEQTICDCNLVDPLSISVQASGNGNGFSMAYALVDLTGNVIAVNQTGVFPSLASNTNFDVYAFNVDDADLTGFINDINGNDISIALDENALLNDYCYTSADPASFICECGVCTDIIVDATTVCAADGTYTVVVDEITGGTGSGSFAVTVNTTTQTYTGSQLTFPGQIYSGGNQGKETITVEDTSLSTCSTTFEVFELNCVEQTTCDCDFDETVEDGPLTINVQASGDANDNSMVYVLLDPSMNVVTSNATGMFGGLLGDGTSYTVVAVNYADADAAILADITALMGSSANELLTIAGDFADYCYDTATVIISEDCACGSCAIDPGDAFEILCNDADTPGDPSDDTFTFSVTVTGSNTTPSGTGMFTDDQGNSGSYGATIDYGPFEIADGTVTIMYTDADDPDCTATVMVEAAQTCSGATCEILPSEGFDILCDDSGTPDDPSDDTFTFNVTVNGSSTFPGTTESFTDNQGNTGAYGATINYGPFEIADGIVTIIYTDADGGTCEAMLEVMPSGTCSNLICEEIVVDATTVCAADGTYTVVVDEITGGTGSGSFAVTVNTTTQTYTGSQLTFPGQIYSGGNQGKETITVEDTSLSTCSTTFEVFELNCVEQTTCDCTNDPEDLTINVQASGNANGFEMVYILVDANGDVQTANSTGTFPTLIGDGSTYTVYAVNYDSNDGMILTDIDNLIGSPITPLISVPPTAPFDAYCYTTEAAPFAIDCMCCNISAAEVEVLDCDDAGTPDDPSDDTFGFTLTVTQDVTAAPNTGFVFDGTALGLSATETGVYGTDGYTTSGLLIGANAGSTVTITLVDADNASCTFDVDVIVPMTCSGATCTISAEFVGEIVCNDNGTPNDPSDDTYNFDVLVTGSSTFPNATNMFEDDQGNTAMGYGSTVSYAIPISSGNVTITFMDTEQQSACMTSVDAMATGTCSDEPICTDIIVDATTVCDAGGGSYSIVINSITGGDGVAGEYTVTIDGADFIYPTDFPLAGQMYSGDDQAKINLLITDADNITCTTTYEVFELNCVDNEICDCANAPNSLTINTQASADANGFDLVYILTDGANVTVNQTGTFPNINGTGVGYTVYAVHVESADLAVILSVVTFANLNDLIAMVGIFENACYDIMSTDFIGNCNCAVCSFDNLMITPICDGSIEGFYDLEICVDVTNPESEDFVVTVDGVDFGPFLFSILDANNCFVISGQELMMVGDEEEALEVTIGQSILNNPNPFISEIHYDNVGTDENEGVEITAPQGFDLTGYTLVFYTSASSTDEVDLSGIVAGENCGAIFFPIEGIQNGPAEGIALIDPSGNVLEFLSFEGTLVALTGPAAGMTSIDIGVSEVSSDPLASLQLTDFGWVGPTARTPDELNVGLSCLVQDPDCSNTETFDEISCFDPCLFTVAPVVNDTIPFCSGDNVFIPIEPGVSFSPTDATNLFFSEYIEGTGANRCLELFNGTGMPINLDGWTIEIYNNGNTTPNTTATLPNVTIADDDVFVICDPDASPFALSVTDLQSSSATAYTGNDDIVLIDPNGVPVDILGTVGSAIDFGTDRSFIRDCSTIEGNPDVSLTFIPTEFGWSDSALNDFSMLGDHNYCGVAETPNDCVFSVYLEDPSTGAYPILTAVENGFNVDELGDITDNQISYIVCVTPEGCVSPPKPVLLTRQDLGTISCEDVIQVSLGTTCEFEVTGDLLFSDGRDITFYDLVMVPEFGDTLSSNIITDQYEGQTLQYTLTDLCSGISCWGEIKVEVKFKPFLTTPCSFIPGYSETFTGEFTEEVNEVASFETIDHCQLVNIDIDADLKYNCGTPDNLNWCEGTYTVNVTFFDILVYTDSGLSGSASIQFDDLVRVGDYDIEIIPEQVDVDGSYTVEIVVQPCDPEIECIFTCAENGPLDSIFFSTLTKPHNGFLTLNEASNELAQSCFQPVFDLRQFVEETGDLCDGGFRREVVYQGTIIDKNGDPEKIEVLRQVYREVQTPFSSIVKPHDLELECDAPNDPQSIYDQLLFEENNSLADSIAISNAFPYVFLLSPDTLRIGRTVDVEVEVLVHYLERIDTIEVERTINGELLLVDLILQELRDSIRIDTVRRLVTILQPFTPDNPKCGYVLNYDDIVVPKCGNEVLTLRTWTFIDWCTQEAKSLPIQRILNVDSGPSIQDSLIDQTISIDPFSCAGTFELPDITTFDDCGTPDGLTIDWSTDEGTIVDGFVTNLWEDNSPVTLIASVSDECGNTSKDTMLLIVEDLIAPTAVCLDDIQVGITEGGVVFVDAVSFDNGSNDFGCGDVWIKSIRREDLRGTSNGFWNDNGPNRQVQYSTVPDANFTSRFTCNNAEADDFTALFRDFNDNIIGVEIGTQVFFDDQVAFCCDEIGSEELYVMVRVFDVNPGPGPVDPRRMEREPTGPIFVRRGGSLVVSTNAVDNDLFGHFTDCWVRINLTNKIDPIITCSNYDLTCLDDLSTVPMPQALGGVCAQSRVELLDETSLANSCGSGDIIRQWFIDTDSSGDFSDGDPFCVQEITINENAGQFDPLTIKWPKHNDGSTITGLNIECDDDGEVVLLDADIPMGEPVNCIPSFDLEGGQAIWCDPMCALVGYSIDVDTVEVSDACLSLIRRHTIIDWCTWEPNGANEDIDDDIFVAKEDWAQGDCVLCESGLTRLAGGEEQIYIAYDSVDNDGFYTYNQVLKVVDTTNPDILTQDTFIVRIVNEIGKEDEQHCLSSDVIFAVAEDLCGTEVTTNTLLSWEVTVKDESGATLLELFELTDTLQFVSPEGSDNQVYTVDWVVSDGCGNSVVSQSVILFEDMIPPTPLCVAGVSTAFIQEENQVTIWANDFDLGSFDACSDVQFSIVGAGSDPVRPSNEFFDEQQSITISCTEFDQIADFDIWVWDESGNGAFCTVRVTVNDDCEEDIDFSGSSLITGFILTELGEGVDLTEVIINTDLEEYPLSSLTNVNGAYSFINNPLGRDYQLSASRDGDYANGVSTSDLLGIQRHILGQQIFDSPFKVIAADANNDNKITAIDIIALRNIILGLSRRLPNNSSWRFVNAAHNFTDDLTPWPFVEQIDISQFSDALRDQNFVAVKIGDVNGDVLPNSLSKPEIRSQESLNFTISDQVVEENDIIDVPIRINTLNGFNGFQTTIEHEGLELIGIVPGALEIDQSNYGVHEAKTTISFIQEEGIVSQQDLFTMRFKSSSKSLLSERLSLSSSITKSEAYQIQSRKAANLNLNFSEVSNSIVLYQNKPNPFSQSTAISFLTPNEKQVTLSIYSFTGNLIYTEQIMSEIGQNTVVINKSDLPAQGVYYYEVSSENENHFKKLLLIE